MSKRNNLDSHILVVETDQPLDGSDVLELAQEILSNLNYGLSICVSCHYFEHEDAGDLLKGDECSVCGDFLCTECVWIAKEDADDKRVKYMCGGCNKNKCAKIE